MIWVISAEDPKIAQIKQLLDQEFGGDVNKAADAIRNLASHDFVWPVQAADTLPGKAFEAIDKTVSEVGNTTSGKAAIMLALLVALFGAPQGEIQQDPAKYLQSAVSHTQQIEQAPQIKFSAGERVTIGKYAGYEDQSGTIVSHRVEQQGSGAYANNIVVYTLKLDNGKRIAIDGSYLRAGDNND